MSSEMHQDVGWESLGRRARAWRAIHALWSVAQLAALADIWRSAITRRRSPRLRWSVGFLLVEGAALVVGRGNCPVGALQAEWGDPVPFFELVLPPRAAKAAVPILGLISLAGWGFWSRGHPVVRWVVGDTGLEPVTSCMSSIPVDA